MAPVIINQRGDIVAKAMCNSCYGKPVSKGTRKTFGMTSILTGGQDLRSKRVIKEKGNMSAKCTLTDQDLIDKCDQWITSLARTGGNTWCLSMPVDFNRDPDMLFLELINRFKALKSTGTEVSGPMSGLPCDFNLDNPDRVRPLNTEI